MPKFKKETKRVGKEKKKRRSKEAFAYRTVVISTCLGGIFLLASLFLNGGLITYFMNKGTTWDFIDVTIKVTVIELNFSFFMISLGNFKELTGKPVKPKEIFLLFSLALVQTIRNLYVFIFTLIFLVVILYYLYTVQEK